MVLRKYTDKDLDILRLQLVDAEFKLLQAVKELCPGAHKITQHQYGKEPWCKFCGRTKFGYKVR